eukprot:UN13131
MLSQKILKMPYSFSIIQSFCIMIMFCLTKSIEFVIVLLVLVELAPLIRLLKVLFGLLL